MFFTAKLAILAPKIDKEVATKILECKTYDNQLFTAIERKFMTHLWYFTPQNVVFSLFDNEVSITTKNRMRQNILDLPKEPEREFRRKVVNLKNIELENFCCQSSLEFFEILDLDFSFLSNDCQTWESNDSYIIARNTALKILSINDIAERGVKIAEEYNREITKDADEYEKICINAYETRKKYRK